MAPGKFWLRVLNVYPSEWSTVKQLYLFQFFQGAGIAFFFTSVLAQFLERFPITELPWVLVLAACLIWLVGLVYTRLEHHMPFRRFNMAVILFMAGSVLLLWVSNLQYKTDWYLYVALAWFNVLYLLNNLQFWGIAALLFDLRQSKRLFAVISGGDIPAKAIGYSLALVIVPYTGTASLLLFGAACMIISLPFFNAILRSHEHELIHHQPHQAQGKQPIRKLVSNIATNGYIRRIAFISLLTSVCVILINYGFYGEVSKANKTDVALATFIAFFYASLRIIAFIMKMVFTSRLTASLGIRQSLYITPVIMLALALVIVFAGKMAPQEKIIFYLFGVCSMVVDVLRTSLNSPVLLTLMQPLPTYERLRAHNIVKGIMDPFASFFAGVFLLILFYLHNRVDLLFLCYVLIALGILWLIGVVLVNRQYTQILVKTISSRYFSREEFNLNDDAIKDMIRKKMMSGTDVEVISILRMLNSEKDKASQELIEHLLGHPSGQVRLEALRLFQRPANHTRVQLELLIEKDQNPFVRQEATRTYCRIGSAEWNVDRFADHADEEIRKAAISGMLMNTDTGTREKAEQLLNQMLKGAGNENKHTYLAILHHVKDEYDHPQHSSMITDDDPGIRIAAIKSAGKSCSAQTMEALVSQLPHHEKLVIAALHSIGSPVVPLLKDQFYSNKTPVELKTKLVALCGRIGGEDSKKMLLEMLVRYPGLASPVVRALHRCRYTASHDSQKLLESIARMYIVYGVELMHMQQALKKENPSYNMLDNSIQLELQEIRETLLSLFGCLYDRAKINQVKYGLNAHQKDSVANAMEIIEVTVKKDIGRQFNMMFESIEVEQRCIALRALFPEKEFEQIEEILTRILTEKPITYYNWTKACSLYVSGKHGHTLEKNLFEKFIQSDNRLLKETAIYATTIP